MDSNYEHSFVQILVGTLVLSPITVEGMKVLKHVLLQVYEISVALMIENVEAMVLRSMKKFALFAVIARSRSTYFSIEMII